jgi:hypothetical protein
MSTELPPSNDDHEVNIHNNNCSCGTGEDKTSWGDNYPFPPCECICTLFDEYGNVIDTDRSNNFNPCAENADPFTDCQCPNTSPLWELTGYECYGHCCNGSVLDRRTSSAPGDSFCSTYTESGVHSGSSNQNTKEYEWEFSTDNGATWYKYLGTEDFPQDTQDTSFRVRAQLYECDDD